MVSRISEPYTVLIGVSSNVNDVDLDVDDDDDDVVVVVVDDDLCISG